jgi:hypothetical protein
MRPPGVYLSAIREAGSRFAEEAVTWYGISFIVLIAAISVATPISLFAVWYMFGGFSPEQLQAEVPFGRQLLGNSSQILVTTLLYPLLSGVLWTAYKQVRGEAISVSTIFEARRALWTLLKAGFVYGVLVEIGMTLFIVPGLLARAAFCLAPILILEKQMPAADALMTSARLMGLHTRRMLWLILLLSVFVVTGGLLCLVGAIFAIPIYYLTLALHATYFLTQPELADVTGVD